MGKLSTGATAGLSVGVSGAFTTALLFLAKHFHVDDLQPTDAAAFVTIGGFVVGTLIHIFCKD